MHFCLTIMTLTNKVDNNDFFLNGEISENISTGIIVVIVCVCPVFTFQA